MPMKKNHITPNQRRAGVIKIQNKKKAAQNQKFWEEHLNQSNKK